MNCPQDFSAQRHSSKASSSGRPALQATYARRVFAGKANGSRRWRRRLTRALALQDHVSQSKSSGSQLDWSGLPHGLLGTFSALQAAALIVPPSSSAAESVNVEFLSGFLSNIEHLGPYGPLFYVAVMVGAEMVPLFPTQPLTIASGLLFGGPKGALLAVISTTSAAMLAFQLSRQLGKKIAEKAAAEEITEEQRNSGIFTRVQHAIDSGSFQQQLVAVTLLRLTPVVPFSATNYLLGATPLQLPAYICGSVVGLTFWCSIYATLGAAGRELLRSGMNLEALYDELLTRAGSYTENAAIIMGIAGICVALYVKFGPQAVEPEADSDKHKEKRT